MREADEYTIRTLGMPSLVLMERAGEALAAAAEKMCPKGDIVCVCGGGNNGGDGFVCARILAEKGRRVAAVCVADKFTPECRTNKEKFEKAGGEVFSVFPRRRFALAVDCLFGTGFRGEPEGKAGAAIDYINSVAPQVLSADIPSGVSGEGVAAKRAVRASETLCIGEYKTGVFLGDGLDFAGKASRADIGISLPEERRDTPFSRGGRRSPLSCRRAGGIRTRALTAGRRSPRAAKNIRARHIWRRQRPCAAAAATPLCSCPKAFCRTIS